MMLSIGSPWFAGTVITRCVREGTRAIGKNAVWPTRGLSPPYGSATWACAELVTTLHKCDVGRRGNCLQSKDAA